MEFLALRDKKWLKMGYPSFVTPSLGKPKYSKQQRVLKIPSKYATNFSVGKAIFWDQKLCLEKSQFSKHHGLLPHSSILRFTGRFGRFLACCSVKFTCRSIDTQETNNSSRHRSKLFEARSHVYIFASIENL